jgi:putative tryptophan/tyrosine transport system substrate-binding protein
MSVIGATADVICSKRVFRLLTLLGHESVDTLQRFMLRRDTVGGDFCPRGDPMRRRELIVALGGAMAWPFVARGQQRNIKRLAVFSPSEPSASMHQHSENRYYVALFEELRRLGWVEGQNLTVEGYGREQNKSGPDILAMEIVRSSPDVIYMVGPGAVSFKPVTSRIPIVALTADPVALGIAQSLAHPGGNFTGASIDTGPSIHGKRIALLREMFPAISKMGCLALRFQWDGQVLGPAIRAAAEAAGIPLAVALVDFGASEANYRAAIESISHDGANAIMVADSADVLRNSTLIAGLVREAKLPAIFTFREPVEAGGLMAYSFDLFELYKRAANNIDAILRGTNPGDIPFYQATKFELSINLRAAKQLGISVPPELVAGADNVIE